MCELSTVPLDYGNPIDNHLQRVCDSDSEPSPVANVGGGGLLYPANRYSLICSEFAIVILNAMCLGSEAVCWTTAVETNAIHHLLNFIEISDHNMHTVSGTVAPGLVIEEWFYFSKNPSFIEASSPI